MRQLGTIPGLFAVAFAIRTGARVSGDAIRASVLFPSATTRERRQCQRVGLRPSVRPGGFQSTAMTNAAANGTAAVATDNHHDRV